MRFHVPDVVSIQRLFILLRDQKIQCIITKRNSKALLNCCGYTFSKCNIIYKLDSKGTSLNDDLGDQDKDTHTTK